MTTASDPRAKTTSGFFGWLRRLDDGVFRLEQAIVAFALSTITVVIFLDVVARRVEARDSKVGALISKFAGITDRETQVYVDTEIAPWVTVGLSLLLVGFGVFAARRFARERAAQERAAPPTLETDPKAGFRDAARRAGPVESPPLGRELGIAAGVAALVVAGGWALGQGFAALESSTVYALFFLASGLGIAVALHRTGPPRWMALAATSALVGLTLAMLAVQFVPLGYTWSKQVALMLLLWVGMLSASICVHEGKHIRMEATSKLVPPKLRPYVTATGMLVAAGFCALMAYLGFLYVVGPKASDDEYLPEILTLFGTRYVYGFEGMIGREGLLEGTDIPDWLGIVSAPIGFGIATLRFTGAAVSAVMGGTYGAAAAEEGMEEALAAREADPAPEDPAEADLVESEQDAAEESDDDDAAPDPESPEAEPEPDPPPKTKAKKRKQKRGRR